MQPEFTDIEPDHALFENGSAEQARFIDALVATVHENERPLAGLSGLLDWRFHGAISRGLRSGTITGAIGECVYLPISKNGSTYRLILAGAGKSSRPGERSALPIDSLRALQKNLASLRLSSVGISRQDFGSPPEEFFAKNLKGLPLKVLP